MPWRKSLTTIAATALAGAMTLGVVGCGASDAPASDGKTLTVWMKKQLLDVQNTAFVDRAKAYGKEKGIDVNVEIIAYEDLYPKWAAALESGNVPDVSFFGYQEVGQFAAQGVLNDVSAVVNDVEKANGSFVDSVKKPVTLDGGVFGVPFWSEAQVLIYRTDMFAKAGISGAPKTWEEFRNDAKKLTDKSAGVYGGGIGYGQKNSDAEFWTRGLVWSYGGTLDASSADAKGSEQANLEAANLVKGVRDDGSMPPDSLNWDDAGNNRSYLSGQSAMVFNQGSLLATVKKDAPEIFKNTAVAAYPAGPKGAVSPGIMNTLGIFKQAKNQKGAADFIRYALDKKWYTEWTNAGVPLAIPVYKDMLTTGVWTEPINKAFADSVMGATYLGSPSRYSPAAGTVYNNRLVNKTFQDILIKGVDVKTALSSLRSAVDSAYAK